jgi:hypothetical protein
MAPVPRRERSRRDREGTAWRRSRRDVCRWAQRLRKGWIRVQAVWSARGCRRPRVHTRTAGRGAHERLDAAAHRPRAPARRPVVELVEGARGRWLASCSRGDRRRQPALDRAGAVAGRRGYAHPRIQRHPAVRRDDSERNGGPDSWSLRLRPRLEGEDCTRTHRGRGRCGRPGSHARTGEKHELGARSPLLQSTRHAAGSRRCRGARAHDGACVQRRRAAHRSDLGRLPPTTPNDARPRRLWRGASVDR